MAFNIEGGIVLFFFIGVLTGLAASAGRDAIGRAKERFGGKNALIIMFWLCGGLLWFYTSQVADFLGTSRSDITLLVIALLIIPTLMLLFQERRKIQVSYQMSKEIGSKAKQKSKTIRSKMQR